MTITDHIATHRGMLRDELTFNPSQSRPPVAYVYDEHERALVPDTRPLVIFKDGAYVEVPDSATQSTQVGMPMSARMLRYVQDPGPDTPWSKALRSLKAECIKSHPYHRSATAPYWRGSLCWSLVAYTVIRGWSVENAGKIHKYDNPEPVLRAALQFMDDDMDRQREKAELRAEESERLAKQAGATLTPSVQPTVVHHVVPGMHAEDCQQCLRELA